MPRTTREESVRMLERMKSHASRGLSMEQIARIENKSRQAVHQYFARHGLKTMVQRAVLEINVDSPDAGVMDGPAISGDDNDRHDHE